VPRSAELTLVGARGTGQAASEPGVADVSVVVGAAPAEVALAACGAHDAAANTQDIHAPVQARMRRSDAEPVWSSVITVCTEYAILPCRAANLVPSDP